MIIGVLTVELALFEAWSLKDKRRFVLSLLHRMKETFNVSVSEIAYRDDPRRCRLGIAVVAGESRSAHAQLDKIVEMVRKAQGLTLLNYERQIL